MLSFAASKKSDRGDYAPRTLFDVQPNWKFHEHVGSKNVSFFPRRTLSSCMQSRVMSVHAPLPREDAHGHRGAYTRGEPDAESNLFDLVKANTFVIAFKRLVASPQIFDL
jgi:hypothetical protein